jgi:hypothetical protein
VPKAKLSLAKRYPNSNHPQPSTTAGYTTPPATGEKRFPADQRDVEIYVKRIPAYVVPSEVRYEDDLRDELKKKK